MTKIERIIVTEINPENFMGYEVGDDLWACEECREDFSIEGDVIDESATRECSFCDRDGHDIDDENDE